MYIYLFLKFKSILNGFKKLFTFLNVNFLSNDSGSVKYTKKFELTKF